MNILKKINRKSILMIFSLCILIILPVLKQFSFYLVKWGVINNYDSINSAYVLYFSIPFLIFVYISNLVKTKRKLDVYDYLFYVLVISVGIATIFSIDKDIALFGKAYRHEGFFTILSYYLLFINWKVEGNKKYIKRVLKVLIIMCIINSVYSLLQIYTPLKIVLRYGPNKQMASGISGNPNFFGSYLVTMLGIITSKYLMDKKVCLKDIILITLFFICLINTQSTGPFISYIFVLVFLITYLFIKKKIILRNILYLIIVLILSYTSIIYINKNLFNINKCEMCEINDKINNINSNDDIYHEINVISNGRIYIWDNSLKIVKNNLLNGVGYDNFYLAYYKDVNLSEVVFYTEDGEIKAKPKYTEITDNAHNVYLHTLVSTGLIGLIPYLTLCILTFIRGLKSKDNLIIILFFGFVGYSVQAFFNINVIQVAPIYYIIIGLILNGSK